MDYKLQVFENTLGWSRGNGEKRELSVKVDFRLTLFQVYKRAANTAMHVEFSLSAPGCNGEIRYIFPFRLYLTLLHFDPFCCRLSISVLSEGIWWHFCCWLGGGVVGWILQHSPELSFWVFGNVRQAAPYTHVAKRRKPMRLSWVVVLPVGVSERRRRRRRRLIRWHPSLILGIHWPVPRDHIVGSSFSGGGKHGTVFWLGITFLTQISRWRFKQSRISLLISHIYVLVPFVNFSVILRCIWR